MLSTNSGSDDSSHPSSVIGTIRRALLCANISTIDRPFAGTLSFPHRAPVAKPNNQANAS